jgi:hypothetical protein
MSVESNLRQLQAAVDAYRAGQLPFHALVSQLDGYLIEAERAVKETRREWQELEILNALILDAQERNEPSPEHVEAIDGMLAKLLRSLY